MGECNSCGAVALDDVCIETLLLPVSFVRAGKIIREVLKEKRPDVLVMLGQRGVAWQINK